MNMLLDQRCSRCQVKLQEYCQVCNDTAAKRRKTRKRKQKNVEMLEREELECDNMFNSEVRKTFFVKI